MNITIIIVYWSPCQAFITWSNGYVSPISFTTFIIHISHFTAVFESVFTNAYNAVRNNDTVKLGTIRERIASQTHYFIRKNNSLKACTSCKSIITYTGDAVRNRNCFQRRASSECRGCNIRNIMRNSYSFKFLTICKRFTAYTHNTIRNICRYHFWTAIKSAAANTVNIFRNNNLC